MLVEICVGPNRDCLYMCADVTDRDMEDLRAMNLEKTLDPQSVQQLWDLMPHAKPQQRSDFIRKAVWKPHDRDNSEVKNVGPDFKDGMAYKLLHPEQIKKAPRWNWDHLFAVLRVNPKTDLQRLHDRDLHDSDLEEV